VWSWKGLWGAGTPSNIPGRGGGTMARGMAAPQASRAPGARGVEHQWRQCGGPCAPLSSGVREGERGGLC